jgi:LCP family protein required for cell wall assembly
LENKNKGKSANTKVANSKQMKKVSTKSGQAKNSKTKNENNKAKNDVKSKKTMNEKEEIFKEVTTSLNNNKKTKTKKAKKHTILKVILAIFLITLITFAGMFFKRWHDNGWTLGGLVATILGHDGNTLANLPRINILVIGQSQNLTDTILVCSYDPKTQDACMLSIPRDTFVGKNKNYASGMDKINALYQIDPELLLSRVNDLTGLQIKYYVKVDTKGLRDLVDSVGGIDFEVPIDMDYDDSSQDLHIHLKAGYQHLDGDKAEQVVRFRHNNDGSSYPYEYGDQDIGRMKTQRAFITEVVKQLVKAENITKVDDFIKIANENLESNFNLWTLKDYAPYAIDFKVDNIKSGALPGVPQKINELWFYVNNKKETDELIKEMFKTGLTTDQEKNAQIKIGILNGTKDSEKMENLKNLLKESGYTVVTTGTTTETKTTAIVNRTNQSSETCSALKELIGVGVVSTSNPSSNGVDFTIIIGSDY